MTSSFISKAWEIMRSGRKSRSPAPPSVSPDSEVARHLDVRHDSGYPTTGIRGIRLSPRPKTPEELTESLRERRVELEKELQLVNYQLQREEKYANRAGFRPVAAQNSPVSSVIPPFSGDYPDPGMQPGPLMQPLSTPDPLPHTPAPYGSDPGYGRQRHHPISPNVIDIGQSPMMPQAEIEVPSPVSYDNRPVLTPRPQHASHAAPTVWTPRPHKVDPFAPPTSTQSPQHTSYAPRPTMVTPMDRNSYVFSPAYGLGPMGVSHRQEHGARPRGVDSVIKPKRPATYDGKTSCRDYLVQFEMIAELNRWDDPTRALELATSLRGLAQAILSDLGPEERGDYNKLLRALVGRFEPDNQSEVFRSQLKGRQRRKGESLTELCQEIKRLARKAYPTAHRDLRDRLAMDSFVDSLGDAELEWSVYHAEPQSIDDAVKAAVKFEAFQKGRQRRAPPRESLRSLNDKPASRPKDQFPSGNKWDAKKGRSTEKPSPPKKGNCFYCAKPGHYAVDCFKKQRETAKNVGRSDSQGQTNSPPSLGVGETPAGVTTDKPPEN